MQTVTGNFDILQIMQKPFQREKETNFLLRTKPKEVHVFGEDKNCNRKGGAGE